LSTGKHGKAYDKNLVYSRSAMLAISKADMDACAAARGSDAKKGEEQQDGPPARLRHQGRIREHRYALRPVCLRQVHGAGVVCVHVPCVDARRANMGATTLDGDFVPNLEQNWKLA
jgi:hypothetical protein